MAVGSTAYVRATSAYSLFFSIRYFCLFAGRPRPAGALLGRAADAINLEDLTGFFDKVSRELPLGNTAIVAEVTEQTLGNLDTRMKAVGGTVVRESGCFAIFWNHSPPWGARAKGQGNSGNGVYCSGPGWLRAAHCAGASALATRLLISGKRHFVICITARPDRLR
jgi:hypothetical protein